MAVVAVSEISVLCLFERSYSEDGQLHYPLHVYTLVLVKQNTHTERHTDF